MIRRFNYTGRQRIESSRVTVELRNENGTRSFDASIDLAGFGLPQKAEVHVEAYYKSSYMRFQFGSVEAIQPAMDRRLTEIDRGDIVFFRVKIVDHSDKFGRILAEADGITPREIETAPADRFPLLPIDAKDLGQGIWRLEFGAQPVLEINNAILGINGSIREIVRSDPAFFSLVFPSVVKQILFQILIVDQYDPTDDDENSWQGQWLRYVGRFHPDPPPRPESEDTSVLDRQLEWIDDAMKAWCTTFGAASMYETSRPQEDVAV